MSRPKAQQSQLLNSNLSVSQQQSFVSSAQENFEEDGDPIFQNIRKELAQIRSRYPEAQTGSGIKNEHQTDAEPPNFAVNNREKTVRFAGTQSSAAAGAAASLGSSDNRAYTSSSLNKSQNAGGSQAQKEQAFIEKMEKKLAQEQQKSGAVAKPPLFKKDFKEHQQMVNTILKRHEEKLSQLQQREDELFIREAMDKIKPKKSGNVSAISQKAQQPKSSNIGSKKLLEEKERKWEDNMKAVSAAATASVVKRPSTSSSAKAKTSSELNNQSIAQNVLKEEFPEAEAEAAAKKWKVPVGEGVMTEKQKLESAKDKSELKKKTELARLGGAQQKAGSATQVYKPGDATLENKKKEKAFLAEQEKYQKAMAERAKALTREGEDNQKKENKALLNIRDNMDPEQKKRLREEEKRKREESKVQERNDIDQEEINRLKITYRHLLEEQQELLHSQQELRSKLSDTDRELREKENDKAIIVLGEGQYAGFNFSGSGGGSTAISTSASGGGAEAGDEGDAKSQGDADDSQALGAEDLENLTADTPLQRIVKKIQANGFTVKQLYQLLDSDGDGVLTRKELDSGIGNLGLDLSQEDIALLISVIDKNNDGVIDEFEFVANIENEVRLQSEYDAMMGSVRFSNPIELEERRLDLELRKRMVQRKLVQEKEREQKKKYAYEKVRIQLQKEEELSAKREAMKKRPNLEQLAAKISELKREQRRNEDEREKLEMMQRERLEEIHANIQELTTELAERSRLVVAAKLQLKMRQDEYQKLVFKDIAYDKLKQRLEEEAVRREREQRRLQDLNELKLVARQSKSATEKRGMVVFYQTVNAVMLVQRIFKGWLQRTKTRMHLQKLNRASRIISRFLSQRRRTRLSRQMASLLSSKFNETIEGALTSMKRQYYRTIDEKVYMYTRQSQFNDVYLSRLVLSRNGATSTDILQEEQKLQEFIQKEKKSKLQATIQSELVTTDMTASANVKQQTKITQQKKPTIQIQIDPTLQKILDDSPKLKYMKKVISKMKRFMVGALSRRHALENQEKEKNLNYESSRNIPSDFKTNQICMSCAKIQATIICYDESCFKHHFMCKSCFDIYHKSSKRKNHQFQDLLDQGKDRLEDTSIAKLSQLKKRVSMQTGDFFEQIKSQFSNQDLQSVGYISIDLFLEIVQKNWTQKDYPIKILKQDLRKLAENSEYLSSEKDVEKIKQIFKQKLAENQFLASLRYLQYKEFIDDLIYLKNRGNKDIDQEDQQNDGNEHQQNDDKEHQQNEDKEEQKQ